VVRNTRPPAVGYVLLWDVFLLGFGLRVTAAGVRSFVVEKRIRGRTRRVTLGQWPAVTVALARQRASVHLAQVSAGQDPIRRRSSRRWVTRTVEEAFQAYVQGKRRFKDGLPLAARTQQDALRLLDRYLGDWKGRALSSITRPMVHRRYRELCEQTVSQANSVMRYLRAAFGFAAQWVRDADQRPLQIDNPVKVLRHQWVRLPWRTRVMNAEQMARWVAAVSELASTEAVVMADGSRQRPLCDGEVYRDLFLFLALTGCRMSEALRLKCGDIDRVKRSLRFRNTKNRRDHTLPLTDTLEKIVLRRLCASTSERVFSSLRAGKSLGNYRRALERIRKVAGVDFSPHDLRRWAATAMEQAGVGVYTIKGVLNHLSGRKVVIGTLTKESGEIQVVVGEIPDARRDTTGGYVQISLDMKLWALEKIEPYLWGKAHFQVAETSLPSMREPKGSVVKLHVIERRGRSSK
jgi:integrase